MQVLQHYFSNLLSLVPRTKYPTTAVGNKEQSFLEEGIYYVSNSGMYFRNNKNGIFLSTRNPE